MGELSQDVRYALRSMAKSPGFAIVVILTLALGIGANTAIFSVVYGVLLRPLPYPQPERITQISIRYNGQLDYSGFDAREFDFWEEHAKPFQFIAASTDVGFSLSSGSQPLRIRALRVSKDYFGVLGVQPAFGREFTADEDSLDGPNVAILSYGLWKSQFGGDTSLLGKTISLDGSPFTVVGVMPAGFQSMWGRPAGPPVDLWTTIGQVAHSIGNGINYIVLARLQPGVSRAQATSYLNVTKEAFARQFRSQRFSPESHASFSAEPLRSMVSFGYSTPLLVLFGAIGFVLLIACANIANLLLSRASSRSREIAIRTALGASRRRIFRQLLTESLLLAVIGGALGLLFAGWGLSLLLTLVPANLPRVQDISLDRWALAFTLLASLLTGLLFGIAPAFHSSKTDLNNSLKESVGRATAGAARQRLRGTLAIVEIAISVILLAGASLLIETFSNLLRTNPGFDPRPILALQTWTTGQIFASSPSKTNFMGEELQSAELSNFYQQILDKVAAVPGVQSAAVVGAGLPLEQGGNVFVWLPSEGESHGISADFRSITKDYFRAIGTPLLRGRFFSESDSSAAAKVALINQEFVREKFAGRDPVGQTLNVDGTVRGIVGVVQDVKSELAETAPPTVFIPLSQDSGEIQGFQTFGLPVSVIVRTAQPPLSLGHAVEEAVQSAQPDLPIGRVESMEQILSTSLSFQRFTMTLMSIFAALALVIAAVGIYGVMAYSVSQRTHEIGIRLALGARPANVLRMIVRQGMTLTLFGLAAGLAGAIALTRLLAGELYGVKAVDPVSLAIVIAALSFIALSACYVPARRAARVDPLVALRYE